MEPSRLLPERTPKYLELLYQSEWGTNGGDGYEIPRTAGRHSIVGVAPRTLLRPPMRTHSLRLSSRPHATVVPLRNVLLKRASLCEPLEARVPSPTTQRCLDDSNLFNTPF